MSVSIPTNSTSNYYISKQPTEKLKISIIQSFLSELEYAPLDINPINIELEIFMRSEMQSRNIQCAQLERTLNLAASMVELSYHDLSLREKKNIALYNWFLIYVDDMPNTDPVALSEFQQRFLRGQPQLNPVLTALIDVFANLWDLYDPLFVNSIITATLEFITTSCFEPELEKTTLTVKGVRRFPWFLREKTGIAAGFGLQIFAKSGNHKIMEIVKALPDIYYWIDLANDILSFHKEDLAGETGNYVNLRADADNIPPLEVLANMVEEMRTSRKIIHEALAPSPSALTAWIRYEKGYVEWHMIQGRYKLADLAL